MREHPITGSFPCSWTTTSALAINSWAIGIAEVSLAQLAEIQLDTQIVVIEEAQWVETFGAQLLVRQSALHAFADRAGVSRASALETLQGFLERFMNTNEAKDVSYLLGEMRANFPGQVAQ